MTAVPPSKSSLAEQADHLSRYYVLQHDFTGKLSEEAVRVFTADEAIVFEQIADRLRRMAPFEAQIRKLVSGK